MVFSKTIDHNLYVTIPVALMHPMNLLLTLAIRTLLVSTPDRNVSKIYQNKDPAVSHDEWKKKGEMKDRPLIWKGQ